MCARILCFTHGDSDVDVLDEQDTLELDDEEVDELLDIIRKTLVGTVVLVLAIVVVHELLHGLVIVLVGGRPTFGAGRSESGAVAFFYTTAPGHLFTRAQYVVVALAPLVVLGALLLWWVWAGPWGGWLVIPAAIHLAGCVGDVGLTMLVLRQPGGTLVEDRKIGVTFHDQA